MRTLTISGNLGHDPELKKISSGSQVANFDVAVRQNRPDSDGEYGTDWIRCAVFGTRANVVKQYFHKGSHVTVSGDLDINRWTDKKDVEHVQVGLSVRDFDLPDNNRSQNGQQQQSDPFPKNSNTVNVTDDDLPF